MNDIFYFLSQASFFCSLSLSLLRISTFFIIGRCCTRSQALNERLFLTFCFPLKKNTLFFTNKYLPTANEQIQRPTYRCHNFVAQAIIPKPRPILIKKKRSPFFRPIASIVGPTMTPETGDSKIPRLAETKTICVQINNRFCPSRKLHIPKGR